MATITTRSGKGTPLTNAEVDANFTNLNDNKIEVNGLTPSILIGDSSNNVPMTYVSLSGNDTIEVSGGIKISGDLQVTGSATTLTPSDDPVQILKATTATSSLTADGAGIQIGNTGVVRFTYDHSLTSWKSHNGSTPLNFAGADFKVIDTDNVTELFSLVDVKDAVYGTDLTTTYATQNSVTNGDTLKEAVEAIDAEDIPTIKTDLSSVVSDVSTINTNLYSVIHLFEEVTSGKSLDSVSGTHYFITPASGETGGTITITLPSANKGRVTFTLEDNTNGNLIIQPFLGDTIGSGVGTDDLTIDTVSTVSLVYISSTSEWKILSNNV